MPNATSAAAVYAMVSSKAFQERKCVDAGALSYEVTVLPTAGGVHITTRRTLPTTHFPGLLRKFVPSRVTSTETIEWHAEAADLTRTAELSVAFHGVPASLARTIRIVPNGASAATIIVDAEFSAHVPLIGRRVEGFAAPIILAVIDSEEATGQAWAAGSSRPISRSPS